MNNCRSFASKKKLDEYLHTLAEESRLKAEALPVNYEDLIFLVTVDVLGPPETVPEFATDVYLSVFSDDPGAALLRRFANVGYNIQPESYYDGEQITLAHGPKYFVTISGVEAISADMYVVKIGSYCGTACADEVDYTVIRKGENFEIVDRKLLWIS